MSVDDNEEGSGASVSSRSLLFVNAELLAADKS